MAANLDGWSRTRSLLCGERTGRQAAALFGGARMVGSCLIWIPGLASIVERKSPPSLPEGGGLLVGSVVGGHAAASDISVRKSARGRRGSAHGRRHRDSAAMRPCSSASGHRHADYGGWPRLAIEDEINGKAIRLSPQEHGSGGSIQAFDRQPRKS